MAETSRMNGLNLKTSIKAVGGKIELTTNLGNFGAKVKKLEPSNDPGPMTSPSVQGPSPVTKRG